MSVRYASFTPCCYFTDAQFGRHFSVRIKVPKLLGLFFTFRKLLLKGWQVHANSRRIALRGDVGAASNWSCTRTQFISPFPVVAVTPRSIHSWWDSSTSMKGCLPLLLLSKKERKKKNGFCGRTPPSLPPSLSAVVCVGFCLNRSLPAYFVTSPGGGFVRDQKLLSSSNLVCSALLSSALLCRVFGWTPFLLSLRPFVELLQETPLAGRGNEGDLGLSA